MSSEVIYMMRGEFCYYRFQQLEFVSINICSRHVNGDGRDDYIVKWRDTDDTVRFLSHLTYLGPATAFLRHRFEQYRIRIFRFTILIRFLKSYCPIEEKKVMDK